MSEKIEMLAIGKIRADSRVQSRTELDQFTIDTYAERMKEGVCFPPVVVFFDGKDHWLADGFHRLEAEKQIGSEEINVEKKKGGKRDATLYSIGSNISHGLARSNADKRRSVEMLLDDEEWLKWSDRAIAKLCGVSHSFVSKVRSEFSLETDASGTRSYITRHGSEAKMKTALIGVGKNIDPELRVELATTDWSENKDEVKKLARLQAPEQKQVVERIIQGEARTVKEAKHQIEMSTLESDVAQAALPEGQFDVLVIDPPWQYSTRANDSTHRAANPYPSMSIEELCDINIPAGPDCVLWLWVTNGFMHEAYFLLQEWGFEQKTILTWAKDRMGLGDWLRGQTEHCLMAVKGHPKVKLTNQTTVLEGKMREHSRKPDEFYAMVEALCPGKKAELFSRQEREGWTVFGAEKARFNEEAA